jgi:hypothetical protein
VPRIVEDVRAAISLLAAIALVLIVWDQVVPFLPRTRLWAGLDLKLRLGRIRAPHVLSALVGFYFGSRS